MQISVALPFFNESAQVFELILGISPPNVLDPDVIKNPLEIVVVVVVVVVVGVVGNQISLFRLTFYNLYKRPENGRINLRG